MDVTAVFRELLLSDAEELGSARVFCDPQQIVGLLHHRRAPAAAVDDCCLVTEPRTVQGCGHTGGATANDHDFVLLYLCLLTHVSDRLFEWVNSYVRRNTGYPALTLLCPRNC